MDGIERLFKTWIDGKIGRREFLVRLEQERTQARAAILRWWRSPPAFEAVWSDLDGFNEQECERRVNDSFSEAYSSVVRKLLRPVLARRVSATAEMRLFYKEIKPILLSDLYRRAEEAETIEEVYFVLGDDLTHWLVVYLAPYLNKDR